MRYILPLCIILFALSLVGEIGGLWWGFDLFAHWRFVYLAGGLGLLAVVAYFRRHKLAMAVLAIMAVHVLRVLPYLQPTGADVLGETETIKIAFSNTYWHNHNIKQIVKSVETSDPDLIIFFEITPDDYEEVSSELVEKYPYGRHQPGVYAFNVAYMSKRELSSDETIFFTRFVPSMKLQVPVGKEELTVIGMHPYSPVLREFTERRNSELLAMAEYAAAFDGPLVVGGDMNISQFSPIFADVLQISGLKDTQLQSGVQNSWPTHAPALLRIPIDQVLISDEVRLLDRHIGYPSGSDHLPVVVEVGL